MKTSEVILKFDQVCPRDAYLLDRIEGTVNAESMMRLLDVADLKANPREAKDGAITASIVDSIERTTDIHHLKTKGILLAAGVCQPLDRNRFKLGFDDEQLQGVLDGGHNLLAIAQYFLSSVLDTSKNPLRGVKRWDQMKPIWSQYRDDVELLRNEFQFLTPVEIIYPKNTASGRDDFDSAILEIAQARNNNAQLTTETKDHKAGLYDGLKQYIDKEIVDKVEWKANDGGQIRAREIVSLALIPLAKLNGKLPRAKEFNPVSLYRNKGACVKLFGDIMADDKVTKIVKGDIRKLHNKEVESALGLMADIPRLFDSIYKLFPDAYNEVSPGFGRIRSVRLFEEGKCVKGEKKYLPRPPKTSFYGEPCVYDYPDGFIMPIVYGLSELMTFNGKEVIWKQDPHKFVEENLGEILKVLHGIISLADYDPQRVGKSSASYNVVLSQVRALAS